ncbi:hypothetical protein RI367_004237 [Sorochytrium milnesiophthora]
MAAESPAATAELVRNVNSEVLCELLGFDPLRFVDDFIDTLAECSMRSVAKLETALQDNSSTGNTNSAELEQGTISYEMLLTTTCDKLCDLWETFVLRSVFTLPMKLKIQLPYRVMTARRTADEDALLDRELIETRNRVVALRRANKAGQQALRAADRELQQLQQLSRTAGAIKIMFARYTDNRGAQTLAALPTHAEAITQLERDHCQTDVQTASQSLSGLNYSVPAQAFAISECDRLVLALREQSVDHRHYPGELSLADNAAMQRVIHDMGVVSDDGGSSASSVAMLSLLLHGLKSLSSFCDTPPAAAPSAADVTY